MYFLILIGGCERETLKKENDDTYSEWEVYDTLEGCVYFKINSLAKNLNNEIFFSAFVREDWVSSSSYKIYNISSDKISEMDTLVHLKDYSSYVNESCEKKIWLNSERMFVHHTNASRSLKWHITDITDKQRSSPNQTDSMGNIWLASENYYYSSNDGIEMYDGKNWSTFFKGTDFWGICFDKSGNLYASTLPDFEEPGIVMRYDYNKWDTILICSGNAKWVPCMHFDNENNLWCGVLSRWAVAPESGDGLYKFDGAKIIHYNIYNSELPSNSVIDIAIDKYNNKWIAMYSGGLVKLAPDNTWKIFNTENTPMKNIDIELVVIDDFNNIWITNHNGLIRFKE